MPGFDTSEEWAAAFKAAGYESVFDNASATTKLQSSAYCNRIAAYFGKHPWEFVHRDITPRYYSHQTLRHLAMFDAASTTEITPAQITEMLESIAGMHNRAGSPADRRLTVADIVTVKNQVLPSMPEQHRKRELAQPTSAISNDSDHVHVAKRGRTIREAASESRAASEIDTSTDLSQEVIRVDRSGERPSIVNGTLGLKAVTVKVGNDLRTHAFVVHQNLLEYHSSRLATGIRAQANIQTLVLRNVSPETMAIFMSWLYSGTVSMPKKNIVATMEHSAMEHVAEDSKDCPFDLTVGALKFAANYNILPDFKVSLMEQWTSIENKRFQTRILKDENDKTLQVLKLIVYEYPEPQTLHDLWELCEGSPPDAKERTLSVEAYAWNWLLRKEVSSKEVRRHILGAYRDGGIPKGFLEAVIAKKVEIRTQQEMRLQLVSNLDGEVPTLDDELFPIGDC